MIFCQPDCDKRTLHCHAKCQQYQKAKIKYEHTEKRKKDKATDELEFSFDAAARLRNTKWSRKYGNRERLT